MARKSFGSFALVVIFFLAIFLLVSHPPKKLEDIKYVKIAGQSIKVDLAVTTEEKMQGLGGRSGLKEDEGMLFVFDKPGQYYFWMKDMNFPIDMIWIGKNNEVVYIKKDARPELYPESYGSDQDAKYVLEVSSGFSEKNNLKEGDSAEFYYN